LLILDEPTSGLDPVTRDELLEILQDYIKDGERSVLFSTHITTDLERIADYITFINQGELFYTGSMEDLISSYRLIKGRPKDLTAVLEKSVIGLRKTDMVFGFMDSSVIVMCITGAWFTGLTSSNIFAIQEKNNLNQLYGSLSIKRNEIVLGRYVFVFLNYIVSFLVVMVLCFGFAIFRGKALELPDVLLGFSLSFPIFSVIIGIPMPMFFKLGYTKAKAWSLIPFAAIMLLVIIPSLADALSDVTRFMMSNQSVLAVSGLLLGCVVQFLSYKIAVVAYRKRR
jgi:hypothetical protein